MMVGCFVLVRLASLCLNSLLKRGHRPLHVFEQPKLVLGESLPVVNVSCSVLVRLFHLEGDLFLSLSLLALPLCLGREMGDGDLPHAIWEGRGTCVCSSLYVSSSFFSGKGAGAVISLTLSGKGDGISPTNCRSTLFLRRGRGMYSPSLHLGRGSGVSPYLSLSLSSLSLPLGRARGR